MNDSLTMDSLFSGVCDLYVEYLGSLNPVISKKLKEFIDKGLIFSDFEYAFEQTAMAPLPCFRYAAAILKRLVDEKAGIFYKKREISCRSNKGGGFDYEQRDYTEDELLSLFDNLDQYRVKEVKP